MALSKPLTVLVVDDHAEFRRTVRQVFEGRPVEIEEEASGEEAVRRYTSQPVDWVIMDLRMPGMGGLKATEAIRRLDPRAQIIMISQFSEAEFREQARQAGVMHFVNKEDVVRLAEVVCAASPNPGTL